MNKAELNVSVDGHDDLFIQIDGDLSVLNIMLHDDIYPLVKMIKYPYVKYNGEYIPGRTLLKELDIEGSFNVTGISICEQCAANSPIVSYEPGHTECF